MNHATKKRLEDLGHDMSGERVEPKLPDGDLAVMVDEDSVILFDASSDEARIQADCNIVLGDYE